MSMWSHIVATIYVETYLEVEDIAEYIREKLKSAPKITGSEGNADIFVNALSGYNKSTSKDCKRCDYNDSIAIDFTSCEAPEDFDCPSGKYQGSAVITIVGNLRDRFSVDTKEEYKKFIKFLEKDCGFYLRMKTVKIEG